MSSPQASGQNRRRFDLQIPRGDTIASFETYHEAQRAVDVLAQGEFPVKNISIIGTDLKSVERVTGKLSYGRAAGAGAMSGAWLGLFFGLLLVIVNPASSLLFVGAAVLIGAAFGMLFTMVSYSFNRRRRDFTSVMQVIATRYALIAPPDVAHRARNLLERQGGQGNAQQSSPPPPSHPSDPPGPFTSSDGQQPPAYGERQQSDTPAYGERQHEVPPAYGERHAPPVYGERQHEAPPAYGERVTPDQRPVDAADRGQSEGESSEQTNGPESGASSEQPDARA